MSTIYSDAAGNKYLGDCRWGNHDINYPDGDYLLSGIGLDEMSSTFYTYLGQTGLRYRNPPGSLWTSSNNFAFCFGSTNYDTLDDRYLFVMAGLNSPDGASSSTNRYIRMYNDSGYSGTTNGDSTANDIIIGNLVHESFGDTRSNRLPINMSWVGTSDSLAYAAWQQTVASGSLSVMLFSFGFAGVLEDVNTNYDYYSNSAKEKSIVFQTSRRSTSFSSLGKHYIASASKNLLETGRAAYTISCSDGQTPGAQWATDMWVYDNNVDLGYPVIGRVPNMLLGIGTYTYLKPVKIEGSVFPDNGSPWYLPVGTYAGKTLLMRCYSSVS